MKILNRLAAIIAAVTVAGSLFSPIVTMGAESLPSKTDISVLKEANHSVERAMKFLLSKQSPENGSWNNNPAITGLVVTSLIRMNRPLTKEEQEAVDRGVTFILKFVNKDTGVIGEKQYLNYSTSVCAMALLATGKQEYNDIIKKAREYMLKAQTSEVQGFTPQYIFYGGIGYGDRAEQKDRPDLSNTGFALEFLAMTEGFDTASDPKTPETKGLHWKRALTFLQRCQHLAVKDGVGNDQPWVSDSEDYRGGAIYSTGETRGRTEKVKTDKGETEVYVPYGSMTYVLLKSYLFAQLDMKDRRVQGAIDWISRHFTVEENPGIGGEGQYYYYMGMAKTLSLAQLDWIKQPDGKQLDWRYELMKKLINLQKGDGSWANEKSRWQEGDPVLVTAYGLFSMNLILAHKYP